MRVRFFLAYFFFLMTVMRDGRSSATPTTRVRDRENTTDDPPERSRTTVPPEPVRTLARILTLLRVVPCDWAPELRVVVWLWVGEVWLWVGEVCVVPCDCASAPNASAVDMASPIARVLIFVSDASPQHHNSCRRFLFSEPLDLK